ncbi:MAG: hypothetical protein HY455_01730 [Parcubacteria group bacterium]|nr:hypothetical protein [Parcubacteria group bacterium]
MLARLLKVTFLVCLAGFFLYPISDLLLNRFWNTDLPNAFQAFNRVWDIPFTFLGIMFLVGLCIYEAPRR